MAGHISHNAGEIRQKEFIMAKLALCFREEESSRPLTDYEINEVAVAAQGASAIIRVMAEYACDDPQSKNYSDFGSVFTVLEWLMKPVEDYLSEYGGIASVPDQETEPSIL
jgi:hypothetical protein